MTHEVLKLGSRITVLPIIHGSGDFAVELRRVMLNESFDCLAVPLPGSFQSEVEQAIELLPTPSIVVQAARTKYVTEWRPESDSEDDRGDEDDDREVYSYVPIDPCQAVIASLRIAMGERIPRHFIDLETARFEPYSAVLPDAYALKKVPIHRFATALLPSLRRPDSEQPIRRIRHMAARLRELSVDYRSILYVCSVLDWPWIREAFFEPERGPFAEHEDVQPATTYGIEFDTLYFMLGELPFVTSLYERARSELDSDENLSIDGIKELLIAARTAYFQDLKGRARKITPNLLSQCLKYIRNLTLIDRRLTPDLVTVVTAGQQMAGDQYALHLLETAKRYDQATPTGDPKIKMGIDQASLPDGEIVSVVSRLPGPPVTWQPLKLQPRPDERDIKRWQQEWNPFSQCSWPPEDELIENFRAAVFDRARQVMGADLARTEKFTSSIKDGIDIRDTLRHWYEKQIYVKVLPPNRGHLDAAVMLFDAPADPRDYPWRTTWFAEHDQESTLAFFATDFHEQPIGPGICLAHYGGALFLYPPVSIIDIWRDPRLDFTETMEERILAAACLHSQSQHVALLSPLPPGAGWRRLAKRFRKTWVHLPLNQFSESTVAQLRMVHVLNGKSVRSYAANFIRRA